MPRRKSKSRDTGMYKSVRYTKDEDVTAWIEKQGSFSASIKDVIRYIDATYGTIDFHAFVQLVGWEAVLDGAKVPAGLTRKRRSRKKTKPAVTKDEEETVEETVVDDVDETDNGENDGSDSVEEAKTNDKTNDDETKQDVNDDEPVPNENDENDGDNDNEEEVKGFDPNNLDVDSLRAKFANLASFDQEK